MPEWPHEYLVRDHVAEIEKKQRLVPDGVMFALLEVLGVTLYEIQLELRQVKKGMG